MVGDVMEQEKVKSNNISERVVVRNRFFYTYYRKVLLLFIASCVLTGISAINVFYVYSKTPAPFYIPLTKDRRILQIDPLDYRDEKYDQLAIKNGWTGIKKMYTYDYKNYVSQINEAMEYFTYQGWGNYYEQLRASNNMMSVVQKRMIVSVAPSAAPYIVKEQSMAVDGVYKWIIRYPVVLTYTITSESSKNSESIIEKRSDIDLTVIRVSNNVYADGVLIESIRIKEIENNK